MGTSECTYVCAFGGGNPPLVDGGGWLSTRWVGGEGGRFKTVREVGGALRVRVGQVCRHSQVLLPPGRAGGGRREVILLLPMLPFKHRSRRRPWHWWHSVNSLGVRGCGGCRIGQGPGGEHGAALAPRNCTLVSGQGLE